MTVFHGDYEVEFEIYQRPLEEGKWRYKKLGHMAGVSAQEAKERWAERHDLTHDEEEAIVALYPAEKYYNE